MPEATDTPALRKSLERFGRNTGRSWAEVERIWGGHKAEDERGGLRFGRETVDVKTFITSEQYMGAGGLLYPDVLAAVIEANSGAYYESLWTGGIGSGKTTGALYTIAYQLYLLDSIENPHAAFGLDPASEITFIFQSLNETKARDLDFKRFSAMIERSHFFQTYCKPNKDKKSVLEFPKRIEVKYVHGGQEAAIGENVIGGIIDEINFQKIVEKSKKDPDGGVYNQAVQNYNAIARRRESRFIKMGWLPGQLCLVSSRRYRGQFTDKKEEEARRNPGIFVYDKRVWEVKPWDYSGDTFRVFSGTAIMRPRILEEGDREPTEGEIIHVPAELRPAFEADLYDALRDHAGVSTTAIHPFIARPELVAACFSRRRSIFSRPDVNFETTKLVVYPKRFERSDAPRFVHIDLAKSTASCGLAIGWVRGFVDVVRVASDPPEVETLPHVVIDGVLEIKPPPGGEIDFDRVRKVLYRVRRLGLRVRWVTYDSWQSTDSLQTLKRKGFLVWEQSMDRTTQPYDTAKTALYDGRVELPPHNKCLEEFVSLEKNLEKSKVDHRAGGSKDCSDAVAGVIWGLSRRRAIWVEHEVPLVHIPDDLRYSAERKEDEDPDDEPPPEPEDDPGRFRSGTSDSGRGGRKRGRKRGREARR